MLRTRLQGGWEAQIRPQSDSDRDDDYAAGRSESSSASVPGGAADERALQYEGAELENLSLAWATTVHKAQGGEFKAVVVALHHDFGSMLLNRRLLYTAVTRARELLVVVGTQGALQRCLERAHGAERLSTLPLCLQHEAASRQLPQLQRQVFLQEGLLEEQA